MPTSAIGTILSRHPGVGRDLRTRSHGRSPRDPGLRRDDAGFTLVELIVVLAIIALLSTAVLVAMPDPRGSLAAEAERFAARARAARERAVMDNRPIAIRLDSSGYAFDWRREGEWRPIGHKPYLAQSWNQGTTAEVETGAARIVFDSTGFAEPFALTLARGHERIAVEVGDGGNVHVRR